MRWLSLLSLVCGLAFSFSACNRQKPEVLQALPGAAHHGEEHREGGPAEESHAAPAAEGESHH